MKSTRLRPSGDLSGAHCEASVDAKTSTACQTAAKNCDAAFQARYFLRVICDGFHQDNGHRRRGKSYLKRGFPTKIGC